LYQSQKNTVLGFSVSEFRVHDLGAPNFPQTWEEEGCTCMEDIFRREETEHKTTSEKIYRTMNLEKWHHQNRKR
jgi:hypothetical protein